MHHVVIQVKLQAISFLVLVNQLCFLNCSTVVVEFIQSCGHKTK